MSFLKCAVRLVPLLLAASSLPTKQTIQAVSPASVGQQVQFDICLPLQNTAQLDVLLAQLHDPNSPQCRQWLMPQQFPRPRRDDEIHLSIGERVRRRK